MSEVLSATNLKFLAQGMWTTLYLSFFIIVLSTLFGTILAVMRNGKNPILRWIASIYIEFVRNVPNLLWIFIIFLVFQLKSTAAGITSFTVFTSAALAEIIRGGLNSIDPGQTEAGLSQGFNNRQIFIYIIFPQAIRKMLPSIISQFVTFLTCFGFSLSSWSSNSSLQRQVLPRSRSSHQLPWRKSFVEDLTLSTLDKRKPACLKDLTTDKSLFILSSHKLFVKCYHLSFLNS